MWKQFLLGTKLTAFNVNKASLQCCVYVYKLTYNPVGLPPTLSREFDSDRLSAASVLKGNQKRSGNPWTITQKMVTSSLSSELLAAIQVPNL